MLSIAPSGLVENIDVDSARDSEQASGGVLPWRRREGERSSLDGCWRDRHGDGLREGRG